MMKKFTKMTALVLALITALCVLLTGCAKPGPNQEETTVGGGTGPEQALDEKTLFALVETNTYEVPTVTDPYGSAPPQGVNVDPNSISDDLFGPIPEDGKIGVLEQITTHQYNNGETDVYYDIVIYADEEKDGDTSDTKTYAFIARTEDLL